MPQHENTILLTSRIPHRFITIEGNIGAGKTTLCQMIQRDFDCHLILEQFTDNPFLPFFYENPERYAFPVELFFMTERHKQLQAHLSRPDLFHQLIVADYFFVKTLLFARNNLTDEEFRLFKKLFQILNASFPKPDLLVYLHRPVPVLLQHIRQRGRSYEQDIQAAYLQSVQRAYWEYFRTEQTTPILVIHLEEVNFQNDITAYRQILTLLSRKYHPGVHHIATEEWQQLPEFPLSTTLTK